MELFRLPETVSLTDTSHMLVLTLILWWARSPMRCFDGRLRKHVSIVAIAALAFPCGNLMPACVAEDRYSGEHGKSTLAWVRDAKEEQSDKLGEIQIRLREGTAIPPTVGKIVLLGRRWGFVAAESDSKTADDVVTSEKSFRASLVGFNARPRPTRLGLGKTRSTDTDAAQTATLVRRPTKGKPTLDSLPPRIIVTENLMLQRIVEAIRADASDDFWTVSGEITEYFDENRLVIRTAQRSNLN